MNPIALLNDEHLSGETDHPRSWRSLRPQDQRILVVDDEDVILDLVSETLRQERYTVDLAKSCEDALPQILFHDYSSILLDLILPDANGLSLYRTIARRRPEQRARVIFVTGALEGPQAARFMKLVDNRVLLKPFDPREVIRAVREVTAGPGR